MAPVLISWDKPMRHFRSLLDLYPHETLHLIETALRLKRERLAGTEQPPLPGRVLGLLFEKPSMRTRVSFEAAFGHLGGTSIFLSGDSVGLGQRETIEDFARIISTYIDLLAVRTFSHQVIIDLAQNATCPVINALSDSHHPCQALADVFTLREHFGRLNGLKLVFVGDGNNVARSLATAAAQVGIEFVLCSPPGFAFDDKLIAECHRPDFPGRVSMDSDPGSAVKDADAVYTDVWASMGQEAERAERTKAFAGYQVDGKLMSRAKRDARFLHCLPAHRGEEVTAEVIDGPGSMVVEQAANRLHAQKALMLWLLTQSRQA